MSHINKLKAFSVGLVGTRPSNPRREAEDRQKREAQEVAHAFAEWEESFEDSGGGAAAANRTWVKGGIVNPDKASSGAGSGDLSAGSDGSDERTYRPSIKYGSKRIKEETRARDEAKASRSQPSDLKPEIPGRKILSTKKKTNLEIFKDELKAIQEEREKRHQIKNYYKEMSDYESGSRRSRFEPAAPAVLNTVISNTGRIAPPNELDYPMDVDNHFTTNLFLGNLNPIMTEQQLMEVFGRYGPLASIKIMYPRTDEERAKGRHCGFVAFMNRSDGERALERLRGRMVMDFEMKMGWGKPVAIPSHPVYVPPTLQELIRAPPNSGLPFNAQPREWLQRRSAAAEGGTERSGSTTIKRRGRGHEDRRPFDMNEMTSEDLQKTLRDAVVKVVIPTERSVHSLINRMVEFVVREGPAFEALIMKRELQNAQYKFLFDYNCPEHIYYRWKLYSILHGDTTSRWGVSDFRMFESGSLWRPPPLNVYTSGMPEELVEDAEWEAAVPKDDDDGVSQRSTSVGESNSANAPGGNSGGGSRNNATSGSTRATSPSRGRDSRLSDTQRDKLEALLRDLLPNRAKIGEAMVWCLDHADAADEVAECITESLSILHTEVEKKLARLYLVSDLLHNSCAKVPNASYYRRTFEPRLRGLCSDLRDYREAMDGRLTAETFKYKVQQCFRAWEDWAVYSNEVLIESQNVFLGLLPSKTVDSVPKEDSPKLDFSSHPINVSVPHHGVCLVDYDGDPLGELDGAPLATSDATSIDSARLDASVTGSNNTSSVNGPNSGFVSNRWEKVDPELVTRQAVTSSKWDLDGEELDGTPLDNSTSSNILSSSVGGALSSLVSYDDVADTDSEGTADTHGSSSNAVTNPSISEERRAKLREMELRVVKYQDEIESGRRRRRTGESVPQAVSRYRQKLVDKERDRTQKQEIERQREMGRQEWERARKGGSGTARSRSRSPTSTLSSRRDRGDRDRERGDRDRRSRR